MLNSRNVKDKLADIEMQMKECEADTYKIYCELRRKEGKTEILSMQSMKSTIGSKNNTFADCVHDVFPTPEDFIAKWLEGLLNKYGDLVKDGPYGPYKDILIEMLRHDVCKKYIKLFLTRNYYRNYKPRQRSKPEPELWEIWFGTNPLFWGIMISPAFRNGRWTNDVSEMRRTSYEYWTIGHVMATGIVTPDSNVPFKFANLQQFIQFYYQIFTRVSRSVYEQNIMRMYLNYLGKVSNPNEVPLLIPEFRFYKTENEHKYRLDFTILNPYTMETIGFELSPQSSHMAIDKIKKEGKTQQQINDELKKKWELEMSKRNEFFASYGISIITFTDSRLQNINGCFAEIEYYLNKRGERNVNLYEQEARLNEILGKPI